MEKKKPITGDKTQAQTLQFIKGTPLSTLIGQVKSESENINDEDLVQEVQIVKRQIHPAWWEMFEDELEIKQTVYKIAKMMLNIFSKDCKDDIVPKKMDVLNCLKDDPREVKVVIIGQDPYPNGNDACGYCFAFRQEHIAGQKPKPIPKSLQNIKKLIERTYTQNEHPAFDPQLRHWVEQGVLLTNTVLTTVRGVVNAHKKLGWQQIVITFLEKLITKRTGIVFLIMGAQAKTFVQQLELEEVMQKDQEMKEVNIDKLKNYYIYSCHPACYGDDFVNDNIFNRYHKFMAIVRSKFPQNKEVVF